MFSSMFRKLSVSKQSISSAFMFLRMLRSCFITNIRFFSCFLRNYAENIAIMQKMRISVNYADPHRRILSDAIIITLFLLKNRLFLSCCLSQFQSDSRCSTIVREMNLICIRICNSFPFEWFVHQDLL